jgi:hypothetical protein
MQKTFQFCTPALKTPQPVMPYCWCDVYEISVDELQLYRKNVNKILLFNLKLTQYPQVVYEPDLA